MSRVALNGAPGKTNGQATNGRVFKAKAQGAEKAAKTRSATTLMRRSLTATMGVSIPLFSLGLSGVGGNLLRTEHYCLGAFALCLMGCVLYVSLSHLAWAVGDITKSSRRSSWLLAVAFDLLLVLGELCHVQAEDAGVGVVVTVMMVATCGLSMALNNWAFFRSGDHR